MAVKNILFKISAEVGSLNEQLQNVANRIEQLGDIAEKSGSKIKKGLEKGITEKQYEEYEKNIARQRVKIAVEAGEKILKERDKEEANKVKAAERTARAEAKIARDAANAKIQEAQRELREKTILYQTELLKFKQQQLEMRKAAAESQKLRQQASDQAAKGGGLGFQDIVKGGLAVAGISGVIQSLKEFTLESIRAAAEYQKNQIAFKTFIGSAAEANKILKELVQLAIRTPFTSEETINSARVLAAYGVNAAQLIPIIKRLGNISAGTSIPLSQLSLVFGQIKAAGKLMGQDLLQLVNAGFNPLQEISERTGESMAHLRLRMGQGKISFDEVAESMIYATEKGGRFYNLNEKLADTTAGRIESLKESWQVFSREVGQSLEPLTRSLIDAGNQGITFLKGFAAAAEPLAVVLKGLLDIIGPLLEKLGKGLSFIALMNRSVEDVLFGYDKVAKGAMQSTIIPREEEAKQLKAITETNDALRKRIDILKYDFKEDKSKGIFTYNKKAVDELNAQLKQGEKIDYSRLTASKDYVVQIEKAYLSLAKSNEEESKTKMYENIKKRAEWAIKFNEELKKTRPELNRHGVIDREIIRLKDLEWDAAAKIVAATEAQGDAVDKVKKKEVDLYVELRRLAKQVQEARYSEFRGKDQYTVELVALRKYQDELQSIEDDRQKRIKELNALALQEAQSTNKDAVLSEEKKAEIIKIVDFELYDRRILAEKAYNKEYLDIQDRFNEQNKKAMDEAAQVQLAIEKGKYEEILKTNQEAIDRGEKAMDEAKTRRQYKFAKDATEQLIAQRVFYINQKKNADLEKSRLKEEADLQDLAMKGLAKPIMMPGVLTALYGTKPGVIGAAPAVTAREAAGAKERADIEQAAKDEIIKIYGSWDNYLKEQHKKRREEIIDGWSNLVSGIKDASQVITDEVIRQTDVLIQEQQKRVDKAKEIADKGNAEFLQREEDRLNKLNEKRRKAARVANAIAKTEMVAQAALAVAKAAGQTGAGAPFAIASTLIALAAGVAAAYSSFKFDGYAKGGYTGDGGKYEPAGTVHKGEFVFTKETTKKYRPLFEEIHKGRTPGLIQGFGDKVIVVNNNMNDRLERIERAILGQNRMQVSIDENGIHGIVSRIDYNNKRLNSRF